jgi:glycine betaine/choline ABC-type transport system substrate-binding protein
MTTQPILCEDLTNDEIKAMNRVMEIHEGFVLKLLQRYGHNDDFTVGDANKTAAQLTIATLSHIEKHKYI